MGKRIGIAVIAIFAIIAFVEGDFEYFITLALVVIGGYFILKGLRGKKKNVKEVPVLSKEKEDYYRKAGMSESEIELFRETMSLSKRQILQLQKNIQQNAKLKAIDLRHDCLKAAKALFKELVKEPTRLPEASQFLYTHLPNMLDLTNHYIEINNHEVKSKEVYGKLEESARIIDQMAALIVKDYQHFVSNDLEDMDLDMSLAKEHLKKDAPEELSEEIN